MASLLLVLIFTFFAYVVVRSQVLTPPYFNLAQGRNITATATCGEQLHAPDIYCRLTGGTRSGSENDTVEMIRGQLCDYCNSWNPDQNHSAFYATDGTEKWWQSPPLSRGAQYDQVNLTVHLGQEFHVAYVFIRMANSPRPGVWALERSTDFGRTWYAWQYFADTDYDCNKYFQSAADETLIHDDQVLCITEYSKVVPLEGGEIVVSLVNGRPSAQDFSTADTLQEWTKATDIRLRLLRTKTLLGHLMAVERRDPTVTRRYYYSIKDISVGGRCVCNGHANTCDRLYHVPGFRLICQCVHNTCGDQCDHCCPGYGQKRWRRARVNEPFVCEPCLCHNHSTECIFDDNVEALGQSIDIHGNYDGGGVCQDCQHNTMGVNCETCLPTFYRPFGVPLYHHYTCIECECDLRVSTGNCEADSGRCLCRPEFTGSVCDRCNIGYYGFPDCIPCDCYVNGTKNAVCTVNEGLCPCKENYAGSNCDSCAVGYFVFPECEPCDCDTLGSVSTTCEPNSGQCQCHGNYGSRDCGACADGYHAYSKCELCHCDVVGTEDDVCDKTNGTCLCKLNYTGAGCERCDSGFYGFPNCQACQCRMSGSVSEICADNGQCSCSKNYGGIQCQHCSPGHYSHPDCVPCQCDLYGSLGISCDQNSGQCSCKENFMGQRCDTCQEYLHNYPHCEECNCNPAGSREIVGFPLGGCGITTVGLLCECKSNVEGRICDTCRPGYWNIDRNNPNGCQVCSCHLPGALTGSHVCDTTTGQCVCKTQVIGRDCLTCKDGYYDLQDNNPFGCSSCKCNPGGSQSPVCNKITGRCFCWPRINGARCDRPIRTHFSPDFHQLKFEMEDGTATEGHNVRYGYDRNIFREYSWRGYAILTEFQPEVLLDVNIKTPSLYRLIYRYVNPNDVPIKGEVTLIPSSETESRQTGKFDLHKAREPKYVEVMSSTGSAFILNPGRWTVSTMVPNVAFLDYFVLIPQHFYEASILQQHVTDPCMVSRDKGPCLQYGYPDLAGYNFVSGDSGYVSVHGIQERVKLYPDMNVTSEISTTGMAHLSSEQTAFNIQLSVPQHGQYGFVVSYFNPSNHSQTLNVVTDTPAGKEQTTLRLPSCAYSSVCRQAIMTQDRTLFIRNMSTGHILLNFSGSSDVNVAIDSVTAIPLDHWSDHFVRPRIICIRVNGICFLSSYSTPVGAVRVDFELPPNEHLRSVDVPINLLDTETGLVQLNDTHRYIELFADVDKPGLYVILMHYYMPSEMSATLPVTVYSEEFSIDGFFQPTFCPSVTGCRKSVTFESTDVISLDGPSTYQIAINNTSGGKIWLDYALIIPKETHLPRDLELQPIDRSSEFLSLCVDKGFNVKSDNEFCRESVFTLTTDFNKGAVECDCDADGSLNFSCVEFGGQCSCKANIIGRTCTACRPDYFGFPDCRPCNCPFGVCHSVSGKCICPHRVEGDKCDRCEPHAYGYDPLIGCQSCNCDTSGVILDDLDCEQFTGQCRCQVNVAGRKCDTCLAGHHTFPQCRLCNCSFSGTEAGVCDQDTSECLCKRNVQGERCDECPDWSFYLSSTSPDGCSKCFCFGTTARCISSNLTWSQMIAMSGWSVTNTDTNVIEAGNTIAVKVGDTILDPSSPVYWVAPEIYLGNKITSYGGSLKYTILFTLPSTETSDGTINPDVILEGGNMALIYYHPEQPQNSVPLDVELPLFEHNLHHADSGADVTREQFLALLYNLQAIHIRASYFTLVDEIRLSDVWMEAAIEGGFGKSALTVEQCLCLPSYQGLSCQECAMGHYRSSTSPFVGICQECNCHGHSGDCDPVSGDCFNCHGNTIGPHCEQCFTGYYGDATSEDCQICSCPLPIPSNNFAHSCQPYSDGVGTHCACLSGYYGPTCESCAPDYYGNPREIGSHCQPCKCNNNIDVNDPGACDHVTGACLLCLNNTGGPSCATCNDWFWGDAVTEKDCTACTCDLCGSLRCDKPSGRCDCRPNVTGLRCSQCAPNTWGFNYCDGCLECECGEGAMMSQCHSHTGICECQPWVSGNKCDRCLPGYWNIGPNGCQECDCLSDGASGCDELTGRCICLPGVAGPRCDHCLDRWILVAGYGCRECDYCIHLLLDDVDAIDGKIDDVQQDLSSVAVSTAVFNRLAGYNSIRETLKPQVLILQTIDQHSLQESLDSIQVDVDNSSENLRHASDAADIRLVLSNQLRNSVSMVLSDSEQLVINSRSQVQEAEDSVLYAKRILQNILTGSPIVNTDRLLEDVELIDSYIAEKNFSLYDYDVAEELLLGKQLTVDAEMLSQDVTLHGNETTVLKATLQNLTNRLSDINVTNSNVNASMAKNSVHRLRAQNMEALTDLAEIIDILHKDTETLSDTGRDLLMATKIAVDNATRFFADCDILEHSLSEASMVLTQHSSQQCMSAEYIRPVVNQSLHHSLELFNQAAWLDSLYNYTRNQSANALIAGQAYRNMVKSITAAFNITMKAIGNAEEAQSMIEVFHTSEQLNKAQVSLQNSTSLYKQADIGLYRHLEHANQSLNESRLANQEANDKFVPMTIDLGNLDDASATERCAEIIIRTEPLLSSVNETDHIVDHVVGQQPADRAKLESLRPDQTDAILAMATTGSKLDAVKRSHSEIDALLVPLLANASRLVAVGERLDMTVKTLREKIELAREQANVIRIGLKFLGNTTVTPRKLPELNHAGSYTRLSLTFKTKQEDALLAYIGGSRHSDSIQNDFLSLELVSGHVVFKYDLGAGPAVITSSVYAADGKWRQTIAERIGKAGMLKVRMDMEVEDEMYGNSPSTHTLLQLHPSSTGFYLGGVPDNMSISADVNPAPFVGSMQDVMFGDTQIGLWNFDHAKNNYVGETSRHPFKKILSDGLRFNGLGYVVLNRTNVSISSQQTDLELQFKTFSEDGLLVYMSDFKRDFLSLELKNGHFVFQYDLGGGRAVLTSGTPLNDGDWHTVLVSRSKQLGLLSIDEVIADKQESPGTWSGLSTTEEIFVGGLDPILDSEVTLKWKVNNVGFDGCIRQVKFGAFVWDLKKNTRAKGVQDGCPVKASRIAMFSGTTGDNYVAVDVEAGFNGHFDVTFKMRTKRANSLLLFVADEDQENVFTVVVKDGRVVVTCRRAIEQFTLVSRIDTYNDGLWHYVSVAKHHVSLLLNIDDKEMLETYIEDRPTPTLAAMSPVYLGGLPFNLMLINGNSSIVQPFVGCLGDITMRGRFINLASISKSDRPGVQLKECPTNEEEKIGLDLLTATTDTPSSLMLPQCSLSLVPEISNDSHLENGTRFGSGFYSRLEYSRLPSGMRLRSQFSLSFKTSGLNGLMFYVADSRHVDFIGLWMTDGAINFGFNCGSGTAVMTSVSSFNDGLWHKVSFRRNQRSGFLVIDGEEIARAKSRGTTRSINVVPPYYVGGVSELVIKKAITNVGSGSPSFPGCIKDVQLNSLPLHHQTLTEQTQQCSKAYETGSFFPSSGGYLQLIEAFKVGSDLDIELDLRPRTLNGILLSVHSSMDYLVLQVVDGEVVFVVDNGGGAITSSFTLPPPGDNLCDGDWHSIRANKTKNIVSLVVDGVNSPDVGIGSEKANDANTNDPLYVGGNPDHGGKGVLTKQQFVGCLRNLRLNGQLVQLFTGQVTGDIQLASCPTY